MEKEKDNWENQVKDGDINHRVLQRSLILSNFAIKNQNKERLEYGVFPTPKRTDRL
jgi:hypothetical protein